MQALCQDVGRIHRPLEVACEDALEVGSFLGQTLGCALHLLPALLGELAWQVSLKNALQIFLRLSVPYYI